MDPRSTPRCRSETTSKAKRLAFDLGPEAAGKSVAIRLLYFAPGITWIPTYRVEGAFVNQVGVALQGEVVNDAEDLVNVTPHLVVGVPNFRFRDVISPLSLERVLRRTLDDAPFTGPANNGLIGLSSSRRGDARRSAGSDASLAPELSASGAQDLFVYEAGNYSLPAGARATIPLWQADVALRHVYTLDIEYGMDGRGNPELKSSRAAGLGGTSPLRLTPHEVWHQVEIANDTHVPWTTGAALLLQEGMPLAQELLTYTTPGTRTLVPVTITTDLGASVLTEEVQREPRARRWGGYHYTRIRVRSTITLISHRTEDSTLHIRLRDIGKVESTSHEGRAVHDPWTGTVNGSSEVVWELVLPGGQERSLTYESDFYVRQ